MQAKFGGFPYIDPITKLIAPTQTCYEAIIRLVCIQWRCISLFVVYSLLSVELPADCFITQFSGVLALILI